MAYDCDGLEAQLSELLANMSPWLSAPETGEVQRFIDAGEYGVAFETLCAIVVDVSLDVPVVFKSSFDNVARSMKMDTTMLLKIKWSI